MNTGAKMKHKCASIRAVPTLRLGATPASGCRSIGFKIAADRFTLESEGVAMTPTESGKRSILSLFFDSALRAWHGQMSLPVVFWGYGVAGSLAFAIFHATALDRGQLAVQQILIFCSAVYTLWVLVAIWRCAPNAIPFWGILAKWLTIVWV
jgi:hypothetical protein